MGLTYLPSPRCLVLVDRRAAAERVVDELVKGALVDDADLKGADRLVGGAALPTHVVVALTPGLAGQGPTRRHD